ncbi:MAG: serine/threonine-protein phosphatase, partial [Pirellulales bacterium]|nr:serine/threonine-protein phosphatase [Pirellulales bacterium]
SDFLAGGIDTWNAPEDFAGGVCAAIRQDDVPIGTLWIFSAEKRQFGDREAAAARLAAAQLALLLGQAASSREKELHREEAVAIGDIGEWQFQGLPIGATLADQWQVDGMIESPHGWATGWHAWDVLPDGSLMIAMAEAVDPSVTGAMTAAAARAALTAHTSYRHSPSQLLRRVGDTLWQTSTGEQLLSMLYARLDPETGEGEVASAGSITAMIVNRYGYRPLVDGGSQPLTMQIDSPCVAETFRLLPGETLLGYGAGLGRDGITQMLLGDTMRCIAQESGNNPLAGLRRQIAKHKLNHERGMLALTRG